MKNLKVALISLLALATVATVGCGGGSTTFTKLPFASNREVTPAATLFLMNLDGTNVTSVSNVSNYWSPSVTADHKKVSYVTSYNVWSITSEATNPTQLTTYTYDQAHNYNYAYDAQISPNGKSIVYTLYSYDGTTSLYSIWSMNADGSNLKNLTPTLPSDAEGCYSPHFSPDSHKIAFACYGESGDGIFVVNADGTHLNPVIGLTASVYFNLPEFTPDGKKIVFIGQNYGTGGSVKAHIKQVLSAHQHVAPRIPSSQGIFSVNLDGSGGALLVPNVWEEVILNSSLYYTVYDSDANQNQIWKSNLDGTGAVKLSDGTANDWLALGGD